MSELEKFGVHLRPGQSILRKDLHDKLGGQTQSGISPSSSAKVVMLFSDPTSGEQHGYIDDWGNDGFYWYSGEGQTGDQEMARGNKALRDHEAMGRELYLFRGSGKGKPVTLVGQFRYVTHITDEGDGTDGVRRKIFRFKLEPIEAIPPASTGAAVPAPSTTVETVPVEQHMTERTVVNPNQEPTEAERREGDLVQRYRLYLTSIGEEYQRHRIHPAGELRPLFSDVYLPGRNLLIEAKGTTTREAIRMAIGQLFDYARFIKSEPSLAVLLPSRPREDLLALLRQYGIALIYPEGDGFKEE